MFTFDEKLIAILESIEDKVEILVQKLLSKNSRWTGKDKYNEQQAAQFILSLADIDPTGNSGRYVPYIVGQLIRGNLTAEPDNPEDLPRLQAALKFFHTASRSPQWNNSRDINQYNWRKLEDLALSGKTTEYDSKREQRRAINAGAELIATTTVPNDYGTTYVLYKITEPETAVTLGKGTRWCTTSLMDRSRFEMGLNRGLGVATLFPPSISYPVGIQNADNRAN